MALDKKQVALILKYLETKDILIVDPSGPCRSSVKKCLTTLGAKVNKIEGVESFSDAKAFMENKKPSIVFTDYKLGAESGMGLCELLQEYYPSTKDRFFVLSTGDSTEAVIAEAAEEEVDCFVLKPYSVNSLLDAVSISLLKKIAPSPYRESIEKGKEALAQEKAEEALKFFTEAKKLDKKPTLACFYNGKSYEFLKNFEKALESYDEALKINTKHFKSLVGKYEVFKIQNQKKESYDAIKKIAEHFPLSPKMLGNAFELAVYTFNFEEVAQLYDFFVKMEVKPEELVKRVSAGLIVCAAFLIRHEKIDEALSAITKAINASMKQEWVILESAMCLYRNKKFEKAEEILVQMPVENRNTEKYKLADFYIFAANRKPEDYIPMGRKLIKEGIKDKNLAFITLKGTKELGKDEQITQVLKDISADFPEVEAEVDAELAQALEAEKSTE